MWEILQSEKLNIKYEKSEHIIKALIDQTALLSDSEKSGKVLSFFWKIMKSDFLLNLTDEEKVKLGEYIENIKINSEWNTYILELPNGEISLDHAVDDSHETVFLWITSEISNDEMNESHTENDLERTRLTLWTYGKKWNSNVFWFEKEILNNFQNFLKSQEITSEQKKVADEVHYIVEGGEDNFDEVLEYLEKED